MNLRNRFAKNPTKAIVYRLAKQSQEWDVNMIYSRLNTKELIEWMGYWKWEAAMLDQIKQRETVKNE